MPKHKHAEKRQAPGHGRDRALVSLYLILFFSKTIRNRFAASEPVCSQAMAHGAIEEAVQY